MGLVAIYDDDIAALFSDCDVEIKRASHVEPKKSSSGVIWEADMGPVGGPVLTGFKTREDALAAERVWLKENILDKPDCAELAGFSQKCQEEPSEE